MFCNYYRHFNLLHPVAKQRLFHVCLTHRAEGTTVELHENGGLLDCTHRRRKTPWTGPGESESTQATPRVDATSGRRRRAESSSRRDAKRRRDACVQMGWWEYHSGEDSNWQVPIYTWILLRNRGRITHSPQVWGYSQFGKTSPDPQK